MTSVASSPATTYSEFVLRTTPPRASRNQLARPRLSLSDERFRDRPVIVVQTPPGFGKTSLLGQWRRECLARGAAVAWITADTNDDLQSFLHCLVQAVRFGCGRPHFGNQLETLGAKPGELEGVTAWLAEVAQTSLDIVLVVDEAECLSPGNVAALTYLLHNVTPNLQVVIGSRSGFDTAVADLVDYGHAVLLGAEDLRFRLDESASLIRARFGDKVNADLAACLHEQSEGWPLGLQILMTAIEKGSDLRIRLLPTAGLEGSGSEHFVGSLLANLAPEDVDFLVRISCLDLVHPDLCRALMDSAAAKDRLEHLIRDTPVFVVSDDSEWVRLHNLIREVLQHRLSSFSAEERTELHRRAMGWLADHGMIQEAARHALEAGQNEVAYDLAEQCLYEAMAQGHQETVLRWLDVLPETELKRRARLRLAVAWALALSERHTEAELLIQDLLETPDADSSLRYECALIASGAAYYADDPDRCTELFQPWVAAQPLPRALPLQQMHANRLAILATLNGDPAGARRIIQAVPQGDFGKEYRYGSRLGAFIVGFSYLWEGQVVLGEQVLRPALVSADADLGRRHPLSCMLAALLAATVLERDLVDESAELLANRLDVLERAGTPDTVLLGYRTAARIAAAKGIEHRALDLLEMMYTIGTSRGLPRLCVASLGEQARMHAFRFHSETCRVVVQRIDEIIAYHAGLQGRLWRRSIELIQRLAHAHALIANQDWPAAALALETSQELVEMTRQERWRIEIMALRAFVMERAGQNGRSLLLEAMNLAQTFGLVRTFVDAHPGLADLVSRKEKEVGGHKQTPTAEAARPVPPRRTAPWVVPSMVLTTKERQVLELLARHLSNKEIAQAMEVGEETVKWHLKNLFGKLDAGTRKHAVRRAQLLGLLEGLE